MCTISGWVRNLKQAGINNEYYKAYSNISAFASKAGHSLKILKSGYWSNKSCWQKDYNKNIRGKSFEETLLDNIGTL